MVLYNGLPRWREPTEVADLVASVPGGLDQYCPHLRYLLLDEGALDEREALTLRNLVAALFRLEQAGLEELEGWTDRVLDAETLEEVFL